MKKFKQWEKSGKDLDEYLELPCEICEELFYYMLDMNVPAYQGDNLSQVGEPISFYDGVYTYMTLMDVKDKYFYLGILPEFKQTM